MRYTTTLIIGLVPPDNKPSSVFNPWRAKQGVSNQFLNSSCSCRANPSNHHRVSDFMDYAQNFLEKEFVPLMLMATSIFIFFSELDYQT